MNQQHHQGLRTAIIPLRLPRPSNLVIPAPPSDPASFGGAGYNLGNSVALDRLIAEVARDRDERTRYNRTYHRHNRS